MFHTLVSRLMISSSFARDFIVFNYQTMEVEVDLTDK